MFFIQNNKYFRRGKFKFRSHVMQKLVFIHKIIIILSYNAQIYVCRLSNDFILVQKGTGCS
jgi:hypothetical protein